MTARRHYIISVLILGIIGFLILLFARQYPFIRGYVGDFLVVLFIFSFIKSIYPKANAFVTGVGVFSFAMIIELFQFLNIFSSNTLVTQATLGTTFDFYDIMVYFIGAISAIAFDRYWIEKR